MAICSFVISWLTSAESVSSMGGAVSTVTVVVTVAAGRAASTRDSRVTSMGTFFSINAAKALEALIEIVYKAGERSTKRYSPEELVVVEAGFRRWPGWSKRP